jgi:hypothetical protein
MSPEKVASNLGLGEDSVPQVAVAVQIFEGKPRKLIDLAAAQLKTIWLRFGLQSAPRVFLAFVGFRYSISSG